MTGAPHLALPLRVDGTGRFATVEQDTPSEIVQNVAVLLATPIGSRVEVPEYGSPRPEFSGPDLEGMASSVAEWEPRADLSPLVLASVAGTESTVTIMAYVSTHAGGAS